MIADAIVSHRVTPRHGSFRLEAVTANGDVKLLASYSTEREALEELRMFQLAADRAEAAMLAMQDGPNGPRGSLILPGCTRPLRRPRCTAVRG